MKAKTAFAIWILALIAVFVIIVLFSPIKPGSIGVEPQRALGISSETLFAQ